MRNKEVFQMSQLSVENMMVTLRNIIETPLLIRHYAHSYSKFVLALFGILNNNRYCDNFSVSYRTSILIIHLIILIIIEMPII